MIFKICLLLNTIGHLSIYYFTGNKASNWKEAMWMINKIPNKGTETDLWKFDEHLLPFSQGRVDTY